MIFNDGVRVDKQGFLLICPKCGNEEFSRGTQQCSVCGTSRRNLCMPKDKQKVPHVNAANARYCELCGAETILYHYGTLKTWRDALDILQKENRQILAEPADLPF